ncbi:MAG: peptidylprolyl isomerase [Gammaproteobacteria bacterium]
MSTELSSSSFDAAAQPRRGVAVPAWLREPLVHFIVLGAALFAVDHFLVTRKDDPNSIVMSLAEDSKARDIFRSQRGRDPDAKEMVALRQIWLDNEVLYREGIAMGMDKGDDAIHSSLVFKALSVVNANLKIPEASDEQLRDWFEKNRAKYDEPARFDFEEAALSGDRSESTVRTFVDALNAGTPGDAQAGLRVYKARPLPTLAPTFGEDFAKELEQAPPGQWRALNTRDGWRAIRLDVATPPKAASFEVLRNVVRHDWIDETAAELRTTAVRNLAKKYRIRIEAESK